MTGSSSECICAAPKFLHRAQSLMASRITASRPGHHIRVISAILMESRRQCPWLSCCCNAMARASALVMHSTRARAHTDVPPLRCQSLPSSIKYCDARCRARQRSRTPELLLIASSALRTSVNMGSSLKRFLSRVMSSSGATCKISLTSPVVSSQSSQTVHLLPSPTCLGKPSHFQLMPSATTLIFPGTW